MRIYFINLASQPDRRGAIEAQLRELGLDATRIEATTPEEVSAEDVRRYCDPRRYNGLTPPEFACNLSHMRAFSLIATGTEPYGLVLEDDVILSKALPGFLDAYERAAPEVDVLKLDPPPFALRLSTRPALEIEGIALRRVLSNGPGSGGTIVSRQAAAIIVASSELKRTQVDLALYNPYQPLPRRLMVRHADPGLCAHPEYLLPGWQSTSTLLSSRKARQDVLLPRLTRLFRGLRAAYDRDIRMGVPKTWNQLIGGAEKRIIPYRPH